MPWSASPKGARGDIGDSEPAKEGDAELEIVGGYVGVPLDAQKHWCRNAVNARVAVEDRVILVGEIKERRRDRERDHDCVDARGAHRERANDRADNHGENESRRNREPPWPTDPARHAVHAQDRDNVAGETSDRHLGKAHHAAVAGEEHQAQRDRAEHIRPAKDLREHEAARERGHDHDNNADEDRRRIDVLQPRGLRDSPGCTSCVAFGESHG